MLSGVFTPRTVGDPVTPDHRLEAVGSRRNSSRDASGSPSAVRNAQMVAVL